MIEVNITSDQISRVREWYDFKKLKNSYTNGSKQDYGALGEIIVMDYFDIPKERYRGTKDYDLLWSDGRKIDVKTKSVNSKPKADYYAGIPKQSLHQKNDGYIFVRVKEDMTKAWILGFISSDKLWKYGNRFSKGDIDPMFLDYKFKEDFLMVFISQLETLDKKIQSSEINKDFFESKNFTVQEESENAIIMGVAEIVYNRGKITASPFYDKINKEFYLVEQIMNVPKEKDNKNIIRKITHKYLIENLTDWNNFIRIKTISDIKKKPPV